MPKKTKDFLANINFNCHPELRQSIIALSYLRGSRGELADVCRDLMTDGLANALRAMDDRRRSDFNEILGNVKVRYPAPESKKPPA